MRQPTAVKLFIGQLPKDWGEAEIRAEFEPFGEIFGLHLVKDRATPGQHKGCAFVTYYENESATAAQSALHDKKTLPGCRHPIQVKPAESETNEENRKLFIGMISKSMDENGLREMFSQFGTIENASILKDKNGSKGCAFIRYQTRLQAQNAIQQMNNSKTMEGCRTPIVVKLADSEKDKLQKSRVQQIQHVGIGMGGGMGPGPGASSIGPGSSSTMPYHTSSAMPYHTSSIISSASPSVVVPQMTNDTNILAAQVAYYQQMFAQMGMPHVIANAPGASQTLGQIVVGGSGTASVVPSAIGLALNSGVSSSLSLPYTANQPAAQKQKQGPDDANLFVYHIPMEFGDADLLETFSPFGNVLSAKVFINKQTGMSKGFGFVSYDNVSHAHAAIAAMNGLSIGGKRLKVEIKRKREQSKPY